jgi:hypothetical protein
MSIIFLANLGRGIFPQKLLSEKILNKSIGSKESINEQREKFS